MPTDLPKEIVSENKRYKVLDKLGEGGTSIVYLVEDKKQKLALKILGEEVDETFINRYIEILKNEFEILSKLRHTNIARVYDFEFCPELGKYFFTTEYVEGTDLLTFTEEANFKTKEELFVQFLNALEYVHKNGLIHCDIKCGNILVTMVKNEPVIKLVDFGFATRHLASSQYVVGTLHYLSPELVLRMADIDARVDIYASGIVLYKLLYRKYPCPFNTMQEVIKWHQNRTEFPYSETTPDYIKQLINRMTALFPSERFSTPSLAIEFINDRTEGRYKKMVSKMASLMPIEGALVGRDNLLDKIKITIDSLKSNKPLSELGALFTGQQGIGKSRIIKELKYRLELAELPIKELICDPSKDLVTEFIQLFEESAPLDLAGFDPSRPDATRNYKIIEWVSKLIDAYQKRGLVIIIDDFHLANQPFLELIKEFEKRLYINKKEGHYIPIYLIIASRQKEVVPDIVNKWWDSTKLENIEIKPLSKQDIEKYATSLGVKDFDKYSKAIMDFSGGVPQLVEAYCHYIISPTGMARPPETLAQSYLERTKSLSENAQVILKILSTAHRSLTTDELSQITEKNHTQITETFQELMYQNFAKKDFASLEISVENNALAQVIKENLNNNEVKDINTKLGRWFEKHEPGSYVNLANYFINTDDNIKIKHYTLEAAKLLEKAYNCSEAIQYYDASTKYISDEKEIINIKRSKARLNIVMGQFPEAIKALEELDLKSKAILADYLLLGSAYTKLHNFDKAKYSYEKGLDKITDQTAVADIVQFKNNLGNIHFYMGELEKSEKYFTEAIGDATICLLLDNNLGLILNAKGQYPDAINFYNTRKKYLSAKNDKRALALCHAESGYIHMTNNYFSEAIEDFEKSFELSSQIDDWHNILIVLGNLVRIYQQLSQYTKALESAQESLKLTEKLGSLEDVAQTHLTVGILYESLGVFDLAQKHIDMAKDRFLATDNKLMIGWCLLSLSYLFKDINKLDKSYEELINLNKLVKEEKIEDLDAWSKLTKADILFEEKKYNEAEQSISQITKEVGAEFTLRKQLLTIQLDAIKTKNIDLEKFEKLADECVKNQFLELQWEVYAGIANLLIVNNQAQDAQVYYFKANEVIEKITIGLSEAYRDSYKHQRIRYNIVKRFSPDITSNYSISADHDQSDEQIDSDSTADFSKFLK